MQCHQSEIYLRVIGPVVLLAVRAKHAQNSSRTEHCRHQAVLSRQTCAIDSGMQSKDVRTQQHSPASRNSRDRAAEVG